MQNGVVESFIGRIRDECLNEHLFTSYRHAQKIIEDWRTDYNARRPHTSLYGLTPMEFATQSGADHKELDVAGRDVTGGGRVCYIPEYGSRGISGPPRI